MQIYPEQCPPKVDWFAHVCSRSQPSVVLPLRDWPSLADQAEPAHFLADAAAAAEADRARCVFKATPISWRRWVLTWELDELGGAKHHVLEGLHLLPS